MDLTMEQLAKEALALPAEARAELAERLAESLDSAESIPLREEWAKEAIRRRDEVRSGRVQTIAGAEAFRLARLAVTR